MGDDTIPMVVYAIKNYNLKENDIQQKSASFLRPNLFQPSETIENVTVLSFEAGGRKG
jgi:hypothetical protein